MASLAAAAAAAAEASSLCVLSPSSTIVAPNLHRATLSLGFPFGAKTTRMRIRCQAGIHIDRRAYFEHLWIRQQEEEAREAEAKVTCPIDCVREVYTYHEFENVLKEAEEINSLVVVDFYNSSCGACKYLLPQFIKLCKMGCTEECPVEDGRRGVIFVKHNIRDEYDDLTDLARFYSIKYVPMFSIFLDGCRLEQFPTRDKHRLEKALCRFIGRP